VKNTDEDRFKELLRWAEDYARMRGLRLNPDRRIVEMVLRGLLRNEAVKGARYCPCRVTTGNPEDDRRIICPCIYHSQEIEAYGRCKCGLFVSGKA